MKHAVWLKKTIIVTMLVGGSLLPTVQGEAGALKLGENNEEVIWLQEHLVSMGYDVGVVDGSFGQKTEQAVKAFQNAYGLVSDGVVGEGTWNLLRGGNVVVSRGTDNIHASRLLVTAKRYMGVPYVWGGTSPKGFDCSGFTQYVFSQHGISLPRTADVQFQIGVPVGYEHLQAGDLVFFSTYEPGPSHSGIYLGDGRFISATSSRGIAIDRMQSSYWSSRYVGARRIIR